MQNERGHSQVLSFTWKTLLKVSFWRKAVQAVVKGTVGGWRVLHVTVFQNTFHDFVAEKQAQFPQHAHVLAPACALGYTLFESL